MTRWRLDEGNQGAPSSSTTRRNVLCNLIFSLLFFRDRAPTSRAVLTFHRHKEGTPERFIFVDSPRKERLSFSPFPFPKKERNRSLGSLFIEMTFRYYESRNTRETLRSPCTYIYVYEDMRCSLFIVFVIHHHPFLIPFPSRSVTFLNYHFAQRHVTTASRLIYDVTNYINLSVLAYLSSSWKDIFNALQILHKERLLIGSIFTFTSVIFTFNISSHRCNKK